MKHTLAILPLLLTGCAFTVADVTLPDGTTVHVNDTKSREGVDMSWEHMSDGSYKVHLTSQKSGTDNAATQAVANVAAKALDKLPNNVPVVP